MRLLLFCLLTASLTAQECKIGVVNIDSIKHAIPETQEIEKSIDNYRTKMINYGEELEMQIDIIYHKYSTLSSCSAKKRTFLEEKLRIIDEKLIDFENKAANYYHLLKEEMHQYIIQEISQSIADYARENNYQAILDYDEFLYIKNKKDLTQEIITYMLNEYPVNIRIEKWDNHKKRIIKKYNLAD